MPAHSKMFSKRYLHPLCLCQLLNLGCPPSFLWILLLDSLGMELLKTEWPSAILLHKVWSRTRNICISWESQNSQNFRPHSRSIQPQSALLIDVQVICMPNIVWEGIGLTFQDASGGCVRGVGAQEPMTSLPWDSLVWNLYSLGLKPITQWQWALHKVPVTFIPGRISIFRLTQIWVSTPTFLSGRFINGRHWDKLFQLPAQFPHLWNVDEAPFLRCRDKLW